MSLITTKSPLQLRQVRTFIAARVKWVCDPYLDVAVCKEKHLKQAISFKNQLLSSPSKSLPLSSLSLLKPYLNLPITAQSFFQKYPSLFSIFQPSPSLPLHTKLTHQAISLHKQEQNVYKSQSIRDDTAKRLAKLLMLTRVNRLPLHIIDMFKFDLGLPNDYITTLLCDYPEYFNVILDKDGEFGCKDMFLLELVSWRDELAVSQMEERVGKRAGQKISFSLNFPSGFDLEKRVRNWVLQWQDLPYISPYESFFHLNPSGDQAEKWTVAVLHEMLWLLVSKKTERENVIRLGEYLGFGDTFRKALVHHPGIFYVSNKIRTQTVVLREAYSKELLMVKHPLMGIRFRYIYLMSQDQEKRRKPKGSSLSSWPKRQAGVYPETREKGRLEVLSFKVEVVKSFHPSAFQLI